MLLCDRGWPRPHADTKRESVSADSAPPDVCAGLPPATPHAAGPLTLQCPAWRPSLPALLLFCPDRQLVPTLLCERTKPPVGCLALCDFLMSLHLIALGFSGLQGGPGPGWGGAHGTFRRRSPSDRCRPAGLGISLSPWTTYFKGNRDVWCTECVGRLEKDAGPNHRKDRKMVGG